MTPEKHLDTPFILQQKVKAFILPSPAEAGPMLREGLAAVGEENVGVATVSTGAFPDWDDGMEDVPVEAPLILFCRGERGLCAESKRMIMLAAALQPSLDNKVLFFILHS